MYDAGALIYKLQTLGAQGFKQDQAEAKQAVEKTGQAASKSASDVDKLGKATDEVSKKAKSAKAPLDSQAKATEEVGRKSKKASEDQQQQAHSTEQQIAAAKDLSRVMLLSGAAVAGMVGLAVAKNTEFTAAMSNVRAATMASAEEQRALGEAALEAGADTAYSASEAAAAEEELAKAGQKVSQIVGGSLNASLALAAAGQLQVARSAEIMATAMTQFRIPAEQAAHVSDVLAAGAGKAQGSVDDLALALSYVGPIAGSVGFSLDETAGTIAYFATQGIIGEKAGTSLRGVLASLQAPSAAADKEMKKYNISMFDANGEMLSLSGIAEQLRTRLGGLSEQERLAALGRMFGNESLSAATLLYEGGARKVEEWTEAVNDTGFAAEQAAMRQDNLAGDVEKLGGAFDTALIKTGTHANDVLRTMVQAVTGLIDMYAEAPQPIQATATVLGVAGAAMLIFAGGAVGARVKFLEMKAALDVANISMTRTAVVGGAAGIALTGVVTVVGLLMAAHAEAEQRASSYADALEQSADAVRSLAADNLTAEKSFLWISRGSAADAAKTLGLSLDLVADAATGNADALKQVNDAIDTAHADAYGKAMRDVTDDQWAAGEAAVVLREALDQETAAYESGTKKLEQKNEMTDESVESSQTAAESYLAEADSVEDLNSQLSDLIDTLNEANGIGQDAVTANTAYQESLLEAKEQIANIREGVEGFGRGLDITTQAGIDNTNMLIQLAQDSQKAAAATYAVDGNTQGYIERLKEGRQRLIDNARAMGASAEEAEALADKVYAIPSEKEIKILADTSFAQKQIDTYIYKNSGRQIIVKIGTSRVGQGAGGAGGITQADGGVLRFNADGNVYRSEHHVAQIARAGDWRVWAEDETGGETYVPHAPSKRARSEAIMAETAAIFGGVYIPAAATRFADGGSTTSAVPPLAEAGRRRSREAPFIGQVVAAPNEDPIHTARALRRVFNDEFGGYAK